MQSTTWRCSRITPTGRCISAAPNASPPPTNASSATPATAAVPGRAAPSPAITAKSTTTRRGRGRRTNADCLFFGCGPDHTLLSKGLLQTKVTHTGRLAWTDGTGPPEINLAHHPDELLAELYEDDDEGFTAAA